MIIKSQKKSYRLSGYDYMVPTLYKLNLRVTEIIKLNIDELNFKMHKLTIRAIRYRRKD